MKRSVRSGIAIAGMAGGFWLLGQAVASADTPDATASGGEAAAAGNVSSETVGGEGSSGGDATSTNDQDVEAENEVENTASTGTIDASGGTSWVTVVAGNGNTQSASSGGGNVDATQNVTTMVAVDPSANGGSVSGSNNASAGNGASYSANASGNIDSTTVGGDGSGDEWSGDGGDATSVNTQDIDATNDVSNTADTGDIYANGGESGVEVIAGNGNEQNAASGDEEESWNNDNCEAPDYAASGYEGGDNSCWENGGWNKDDEGDVDATQDVTTWVAVKSSANGGSVSDSNNASAGNGASYDADAKGNIDSVTVGGDSGEGYEGDEWNTGGDATSSNDQDIDSDNDVSNDASTGDIDASGGESVVEVVAGNGNKQYCWSDEGDVVCTQNITTIINIISMANGGDVSCSNNAAAGNADNWVCTVKPGHESPTPEKPEHAVAPVKHVVPAAAHHQAPAQAAVHAPVLSSAQPSGQLAFTGAETSLPLTLGLLALGAGGALTLAGRRRETATV
jgi:hypothetical protein